MLIAIYYANETCDAKIYNFTLPTRQSFKHIELSNHKSLDACFKGFRSLLDDSSGTLFLLIKLFSHKFFEAGL